jgi:hypothetical protein
MVKKRFLIKTPWLNKDKMHYANTLDEGFEDVFKNGII